MTRNPKPAIGERLREKVLIYDGAMGTSIMKLALGKDDYHGHEGCLEYLVLSRPDAIQAIHADYLSAGCDIIETNTLEAHAGELAAFHLEEKTYEINKKAAELAVTAAADFSTREKPRYVAGSIGPGSRLPSLLQVDFATLENDYYLQGLGLYDGGVDLFQIETCQDMLQIKAALCGLNRVFREKGQARPVSVLITLEKGRMLLGTDIATALATFVPYPLFAFGLNCGSGPEDMQAAIRILSETSPFPLAVMPNAGFPKFNFGKYSYDLSPEIFADHMWHFVQNYGAELVGGCCGTTPQHIKALVEKAGNLRPAGRKTIPCAAATSLFSVQEFSVRPRPLIIGERTNATGSQKFKQALLKDDLEDMAAIALEQEKEGAHLLDLNVAFAGRDEARDMDRLVGRLNSQSRLPIMLDSTNLDALAAGLKRCAGRAVINSANLEDGGSKAKKLFALAKDFGAALVCLAIDETGMAQSREKKVSVLRRIHDLALDSGLKSSDIFLDSLTFTLATGDPKFAGAAVETLAALPLLKEQMPDAHVILGVSNISFGLQPAARKIVNAVFLYQAIKHGLDAAIFHAARILPLNSIAPKELAMAEALIFNRREQNHDPLQAIMDYFQKNKPIPAGGEVFTLTPEDHLAAAVLNGNRTGIEQDILSLLQKMPALEIVNSHLLKSMAKIGVLFENGSMQLPFVLKSAEVVKSALNLLAAHLAPGEKNYRGRMVLATVKGDIHDIGKNLVDIVIASNGYKVFNLGTNQSAQELAAAIQLDQPNYIGLSALLVKSTLEMKEILLHFSQKDIQIPVFCGGAALTPYFVASVLKPVYQGKVHYCNDAFAALKIMEGIVDPGSIPLVKKTRLKKVNPPVAPITFAQPPLSPPFLGVKIMSWTLDEVLPFIEKKILIKSRWRMREGAKAEQFFKETGQLLNENKITRFSGVYGYFQSRREGRGLIVDSGQGAVHLDFPKHGQISLAEYFRENDDVAPFFIVSCGPEIAGLEKKLFAADQYQLYMLLHGFAVQLAETLAAKMHQHIRLELGLAEKQGKRFSPGYPAWPDLADQPKLVRLLAADKIGVTVSESFQLQPELSVSAMVVCHPQADY